MFEYVYRGAAVLTAHCAPTLRRLCVCEFRSMFRSPCKHQDMAIVELLRHVACYLSYEQ